MIVEIGIYSLILSLCISIFIFFKPFLVQQNILNLDYSSLKSLSISQFISLLIALGCLLLCFIYDDFSLSYVTSNSHSSLPVIYKISALWGGHEGSLLIYTTCVSLWLILFIIFSEDMPKYKKIKVISFVSLFISLLSAMLLFFSSPFLSLYPDIPVDGNDLNPLLQDKSMIIHPPMLYLGYVGFIIPFSIAIVEMIDSKVERKFGSFIKPWILMPWGLLTLGICLGSYWAYYELGWGGFWFWDPVENASFMPWLTALSLMHSVVAINSSKSLVKNVIMLSIITFLLSLLGTFLVRSGVVFSVHSFASDSSRGIYLLCIIFTLTIMISCLFYKKSYLFREEIKLDFFSRTNLININNILIVSIMLAILFGTLFPLFSEILQSKVKSVGTNYFNAISKLLVIPLIILMIFFPISNWKKILKFRLKILLLKITVNFFISYLFFYVLIPDYDISLFFWFFLIFSIISSSLLEFYYSKNKKKKVGMLLGHIGFAIFLLGILIVNKYEVEKDLALRVGDNVKIEKFEIIFSDVKKIKGSNFVGHKGIFTIKEKDEIIGKIYPEKRLFIVQEIGMSETAIFTNFFYDIYIAITTPLNDSKTWAVRIYYKPCVRFIWLGGILIFLSSIASLIFFLKKNGLKLKNAKTI